MVDFRRDFLIQLRGLPRSLQVSAFSICLQLQVPTGISSLEQSRAVQSSLKSSLEQSRAVQSAIRSLQEVTSKSPGAAVQSSLESSLEQSREQSRAVMNTQAMARTNKQPTLRQQDFGGSGPADSSREQMFRQQKLSCDFCVFAKIRQQIYTFLVVQLVTFPPVQSGLEQARAL